MADTCGYAELTTCKHGGYSFEHGIWKFKPTRFDSASIRYERFIAQLEDRFQLGVDKVFYERVMRHLGTTAAHVYGGYLAALQNTCERHGVPFEGLDVAKIKKHATGTGNASKDMMVAAARQLGYKVTDHNEADAIHVTLLGWETRTLPSEAE